MKKRQIDPKKFSKKKTDEAGDILRCGKGNNDENTKALTILSNWRAAHSYPMHIFRKRLKRVSEKIDKKAITAERLKRVPSIIKKLNRKYSGNAATMKLTQMQDIAGCRVVLSNVNLVWKLYNDYYKTKGDLKHVKVNEKNYIKFPKEDGYRSLHLVYRYISDKGKDIYNGLLIEVQIRSELQHIWATAVETVDFFTGQAIKSNEGRKDWRTFFKLVSSAFAMMEKCPVVPDLQTNEKKLYLKIKRTEKDLKVISKMRKWTDSVRIFDNFKNKNNFHFLLLELDTIQEKLSVSAFSKRSEDKAISSYAEAEKKIFGRKEYDVVLVGTDKLVDLKRAYPNYFFDTREFIKRLEIIINKY
ncbi:RelA/SpoT domain-containing protein [Candidatus Dojkabacteria bacterium]|nr:RelA/SpoT domain-containing protein [Candidatus Dojkabacteria bacterium]